MSVSVITSPERLGRTRSRVTGVSQSQPSSRSGSPSSWLSYETYLAANRDGGGDGVHTIGRPRRLASRIPRSTGTSREASRETSPNRFGLTGIHDRSFGSKLRGRAAHSMSTERPLQSPGGTTPQHLQPRGSLRGNSLADLDDDNLNPEEVYRSLRRTTAEIQNYSFEALGSGKLLDRDCDTTSQDSGISQMSAGAGDKMDTLEKHMEDMSITRNNSGRSSSLSSPTHRLNSLRDYNGLEKSVADISLDGENGFIPRESHHQEDSEEVRKVIDALRVADQNGGSPGCEGTEAERKVALMQLIRMIREGSTLAVTENFKTLLRVLLDQLMKPEGSVRALVLSVLSEMFKKPSMGACFHKYIELLVLKVIQSHKDSSKEVLRCAESCAAIMGTVLPPDVVIRVLNPLITMEEFPVNQVAIKMLTKVVEQKSKEVVEPHLADVMPGLIKAYDNEKSSVRKSAVFCMVALHAAVGEEALQPHLEALDGHKLKLLHLYIRHAKQVLWPGVFARN